MQLSPDMLNYAYDIIVTQSKTIEDFLKLYGISFSQALADSIVKQVEEEKIKRTPEVKADIKSVPESVSKSVPKPPPLINQIKSLAATAKSVVQDFSKGKKIISSSSMAEDRLNICKTCPSYNSGRCMLCGCYMKNKVKIRSAKCPHKNPKW